MEYEDIRLVNNRMDAVGKEFDWEFESDYNLKDLRKLMMKINAEHEEDLHVNYKEILGERLWITCQNGIYEKPT
jgi:hypothetical protein